MAKVKKEIPKYTVIKDTREQQGYYFAPYDVCAGMVDRKLDTGDYTIDGLEGNVCIERKASPEELAINLGQKKHAFLKEIERMKDFKHKYLILEFSAEDLMKFPQESRIPKDRLPDKNKTESNNEKKEKRKVIITGKYMMKCLMEFQLYDDIHVLFCGDKHNAFLTLSSLFKRIHEMYTIGRKK